MENICTNHHLKTCEIHLTNHNLHQGIIRVVCCQQVNSSTCICNYLLLQNVLMYLSNFHFERIVYPLIHVHVIILN